RLREAVGNRTIVVVIGNRGAGRLDESGELIGIRPIDDPSDVADPVGERGLSAVGQRARGLVVAAVAEVVVDFERTVIVFPTEVAKERLHDIAVRTVVHHVDHRAGDRPHLCDLVGVAGDYAGRRGVRHGRGAAGVRGGVVRSAEALDIVVDGEVEGKLRV